MWPRPEHYRKRTCGAEPVAQLLLAAACYVSLSRRGSVCASALTCNNGQNLQLDLDCSENAQRRHDPWRVPGPDQGSVFVVGDVAEADEIDLTEDLERSSQAVAGRQATLAAEAEAWDAEAREREAESEAYAERQHVEAQAEAEADASYAWAPAVRIDPGTWQRSSEAEAGE